MATTMREIKDLIFVNGFNEAIFKLVPDELADEQLRELVILFDATLAGIKSRLLDLAKQEDTDLWLE